MTLMNFTRPMSPTHFRLTTEFSDCSARSIRFVVFSNSFLRIDYVAPGSGLVNAANDTSYLTDAARIFAVHSFLNVRTVVVDFRNSSIVLSCVCGARCGFVKYGELQRGMFSADVFSLSSIKTDGSTTSTDVVVQMYFATMSIAAPMTTTAVHVSSLYAGTCGASASLAALFLVPHRWFRRILSVLSRSGVVAPRSLSQLSR
ncbi:Hypothetical protein, putative [Bodo saltans]|uniref:Uncharacterized protein n=1 Tax=Bodo saltans TaxID=75058 RepID=A0A0S4J4R4_BODSA|nr:Hypothetical protein, putative [Bodo saltans]|eukprot:CUG78789.1 Hypothetical protein, putative [Bodo saltans]